MNFFQHLYDLAAQGPFGVAVKADSSAGALTVIVSPVSTKDSQAHPALREQFALTGTPEELAQHFFGALTEYRGTRQSILDQIKDQAARMDKAKQAAGKSSTKPTTTPTKPPIRPSTPAPVARQPDATAPDACHDDSGAPSRQTGSGADGSGQLSLDVRPSTSAPVAGQADATASNTCDDDGGGDTSQQTVGSAQRSGQLCIF